MTDHTPPKMSTLFLPWKLGGHRCVVKEAPSPKSLTRTYCVEGTTYGSLSEMLLTVTGKNLKWGHDRLFRLGKWDSTPATPPQATLTTLFAPDELALTVSGGRYAPPTADELALTVVQGTGYLGIDLVNRSDEVRKLLLSQFGKWIHSQGWDVEDVLQEVYRGLLARNKGTCPWDPAKGKFSTYVVMVCRGILNNYARKEIRRSMHERAGLSYWKDGRRVVGDVSEAEGVLAGSGEVGVDVVGDLGSWVRRQGGSELAVSVIPYLADRRTRAEMAGALDCSVGAVNGAVRELQQHAVAWRAAVL